MRECRKPIWEGETMYVKDHMTKNPFTITEDTVIAKALEIMRKNSFHRLPVVDSEGKLIGLVTGGLVEESSGAKNTSLSIYELNYLLSRTKVSEIMIRDVKTITEDLFIEEAAQKMLENEIGVLPVVDDAMQIKGIITDKDIFHAFAELLGHRKKGTRFVIALEDRPGEFAGIVKAFADSNANLENLAVYRSEERGTEAVIKATGEIPVEDMVKKLEDAGYTIRLVRRTDDAGNVIPYPLS